MTTMTSGGPIGVLFVCTGNICRSPLAEGIFLHKVNRRGVADRFTVDSAGTGNWHAGAKPDPRMQAIADKYGVVMPSRARQITDSDFRRFNHLICMDEDHRRQLLDQGAPHAKLRLLLEVDDAASIDEVPDPYYGGPAGFERVYRLVDSACEALLETLLADSI